MSMRRKKSAVADPFAADSGEQVYDDGGKKKKSLVSSSSDASNVSVDITTSSCVQPCTYLYLLLWCFHFLVPLAEFCLFGGGHGALDIRTITSWDLTVLLPLILALLVLLSLQGSRHQRPTAVRASTAVLRLAIVAHVIDFMIRWSRMPLVWDHEYWALNVNACFVLCYALSATAEPLFLKVAQLQFGLLYLAAAFWKLTTSFLDYRTSCGTVLIMEFFAAYTGTADVPQFLLDLIAKTAPHQTILIEGAIGVGMLHVGVMWASEKNTATTRLVRDAAVILVVVFHIVLCLGPVNYAGGFSMECMTRFVLFFESREIESLTLHVKRNPTKSCLVSLAVSLGIIGVRYAAIGAPFDLACFACGLLCAMYLVLIFSVDKPKQQPTAAATTTTTTTTRPAPTTGSIIVVVTLALGLTLTYGFFLPILGLQQMGAPTMYGQVKVKEVF